MLLVKGVTYRIERTEPHCYAVVRLLDDVEVGTFRTRPTLRIQALHIDVELFRDVVRAARRSARTSAIMHVAPVFEPDRESSPSVLPAAPPFEPGRDSSPSFLPDPPSSASEACSPPPPAARSSSSAPPPAGAQA